MTNTISEEVDIPTPDGIMNTHVIRPDEDGPHPVVIVYMPASGIRPELVGIAARIASGGWYTLLPNLYYRLARTVDIDANRLFDDVYSPVRDYMIGLSQNLTNERVIADTAALLDHATSDPAAADGPAGGVGYCMGGRLVTASIGAHPERLTVAASLYGAGIATDDADSPHLRLDRVRGELYFGLADNDVYVTDEETAMLRAHLAMVEVPHTIETYPDTEHGFVFPERYCFAPQAADRHYTTLQDLFSRHLR
ncbi:MAG: dienelactone hydrolase family protein [Actinomycetota bacterium]